MLVKNLWIVPALASLVFGAFTLPIIYQHGLFGFITDLSRTMWGIQVGIDLMCALILGLFFAVPQARQHGVNPWPWSALTIFAGSIGFFAFAARILYARQTKSSSV